MAKEFDPTLVEEFKVAESHLYLDFKNLSDDAIIEEVEKEIETRRIAPNPLLQSGIDLAKEEIRSLSEELQLVVKPKKQMTFAILSDRYYDEAIRKIFKEKFSSDGVYVRGLNPILIRDTYQFNYIESAIIYHEFIHKFIDRKVNAYGVAKIYPGDSEENIQDERRCGASIRHIVRNPLTYGKYKGSLVNELGNFLEQGRFTQKLLSKSEFLQEKIQREKLLKRQRIDAKTGFVDLKVKLPNGGKTKVRLSANNVHFGKDRKMLKGPLFFYAQLASDLEKICGTNPTDIFRKTLLECKFDPSKQNHLRILIDNKLGKDFFALLRDTDYEYEEMLPILVKVQKHIYTDLNF